MSEILFLAHRIPYPPDKGDKIRSWNILKYLAARTTVHVGAFVDDPVDMAHLQALRDLTGGDVRLCQITRSHRIRRTIGGYLRGEALSLAIYNDKAMAGWTRDLIRRRPIKTIFCFSGQVAPYALPYITSGRKVVMDFVDIDSEKFRQYAQDATGRRQKLYARESKLLLPFEKYIARHFNATTFCSEAEASLFRKMAGSWGHSVSAVSNGVDAVAFDPATPPATPPSRPSVMFTGAMDYKPNIDAVTWFAASAWPQIRSAYPQASFSIVGSNPVPEVVKLGGKDGIVVTGRVPSMPPHLAAADVVVAPVRIARGIQNKVLEALAMARPVVATSAAFEGIEAVPGEHLLVADEPGEIAAAVLALLADPGRAKAMGDAARRHVVAHYDWEACLAPLDALLNLPPAGAVQAGV